MTTPAVCIEGNFGVWFKSDGYPCGYEKCLVESLRSKSLRQVLEDVKAEEFEGNPLWKETDYKILTRKEVELIRGRRLQDFYNKTKIDYGYVYLKNNNEVYILYTDCDAKSNYFITLDEYLEKDKK